MSFCAHCEYHPHPHGRAHRPRAPASADPDVRYYSDPGLEEKPKPKAKPKAKKAREPKSDSTDSDLRYYSEPDARNYFEIDYEFLKELRRIARNNCPKCKRKRTRRCDRDKSKPRAARSSRLKENYVYCNGKYHSDKEHCQLCCKVCNRSTETLDSIEDDQYSLVSMSYSRPKQRATSTPRNSAEKVREDRTRERKNSIQSNKSVSFLESSNEGSIKDEPNYTAKSFTNDLKKFLLKPSAPRMSLRDKFIISFKQELEATKKSPKLKAIKGLWKSY